MQPCRKRNAHTRNRHGIRDFSLLHSRRPQSPPTNRPPIAPGRRRHAQLSPMSILPIASLLLGSAFLLFAGGVTALLLPLKGGMEGFSALSLGLIGTGWAIGHVVGCLLAPKLVQRVGHIRSFSVVAACAAISILLTSLLTTPWAWIRTTPTALSSRWRRSPPVTPGASGIGAGK